MLLQLGHDLPRREFQSTESTLGIGFVVPPADEPVRPISESEPWQLEWARNLRSADDLARAGLIAPATLPEIDRVLKKFKFSLPRYYAGLIDPRTRNVPSAFRRFRQSRS